MEVLERMQQVLERAEAGLVLPPVTAADATAGRDAAWAELLAQVEERLQALQGCADRAAAEVAAADAVLADAADGLTRWAQAARRNLAGRGTGAV
jgi:hypothetical protein